MKRNQFLGFIHFILNHQNSIFFTFFEKEAKKQEIGYENVVFKENQ